MYVGWENIDLYFSLRKGKLYLVTELCQDGWNR